MRSTQAGPSSSMNNVRNAIVRTATTALITLLVTATAVLERPSTPAAPLFSIASRTFSTIW